MKVIIAGIDGYLGWTLACHLLDRGHEVGGMDNGFRREWVAEMGSDSATPIASFDERAAALKDRFSNTLPIVNGDLREPQLVSDLIKDTRPDAVVQLGECPSAPYSMIDADHTVFVQVNNITSSFNLMFAMKEYVPEAHLLKLGTMGEYGTPNIDIPEGFFEVDFRGRKDRLPFPRQAGSFYHWSKVHGSNNLMFACKIWGMRATDIMQGVVYGTSIDATRGSDVFNTRLDFDQSFGTAINRFVCSALIGEPLTVYGSGKQKRGFLPLKDSMQCLTLALENPPTAGEYRVLNQFEEVYSISDLAQNVVNAAKECGIDATIAQYENPRIEAPEHYYNPDHQGLFDLGYQPTRGMHDEIVNMFKDLQPHVSRLEAKRDVLVPDIHWAGERTKVKQL